MVKDTWITPDFEKNGLAQQYNNASLYRTFHRSTEKMFKHKNKKYLKTVIKDTDGMFLSINIEGIL